MPWETSVAKSVFSDELHSIDALTMPAFWSAERILDEGTDSHVVAATLGQTASSSRACEGVSFFRAVSNLTDHSFVGKMVMESACRKWLSILELCPNSSTVSKHLSFSDVPEDVEQDMDVIQSIIGVRSPSTALTRANMVRKFLAWVFDKHPHVDRPFCESLLWQYFGHLRAIDASPTTASSTLSAMRYAQHIFGFECLAESTGSRRLIGVSEVMYSNKDVVRQAIVLTVQNVLDLHAKLVDSNAHPFDRAGAGLMLLCVYGRCRHSDLAMIMVDRVEHDRNAEAGYVEVFTRYHKTARGGPRRPCFSQYWSRPLGSTEPTGSRVFVKHLHFVGYPLKVAFWDPSSGLRLMSAVLHCANVV